MRKNKSFTPKQMVMLALLAAIAYLMVTFIRIPVVMFLKYEPKDVIITIGGFLFGPMASFVVSLLVSLIEMVTISDTTPEGYTFAGFQSASMSAVTQSSRLRPYYPSNALTEKVVGFYNDQNSNSSTYNAKPTARDGSNYYVVVEATLVYLRSDLAA